MPNRENRVSLSAYILNPPQLPTRLSHFPTIISQPINPSTLQNPTSFPHGVLRIHSLRENKLCSQNWPSSSGEKDVMNHESLPSPSISLEYFQVVKSPQGTGSLRVRSQSTPWSRSEKVNIPGKARKSMGKLGWVYVISVSSLSLL